MIIDAGTHHPNADTPFMVASNRGNEMDCIHSAAVRSPGKRVQVGGAHRHPHRRSNQQQER